MSKAQKKECEDRLATSLDYAGATFPDDEFDDPGSSSSSSSGRESSGSRRRRRRRKVKSGSKVKKRSVVRTELWPHTILNEEEGGEWTSENIMWNKFFY